MRAKPWLIVLSGVVVLILITGACSAGFIVGRVFAPETASLPANGSTPEIGVDVLPTQDTVGVPVESLTPDELGALFEPFWEAWDLVNERYVDQPIDEEALMRGAITGMMDALGDQHTSYMDPDQYMQASMSLDGTYEGIGAWVDADAEYLTIVSPMPDSPAEKAGLLPGDQIIAIDGEDMTGIDGNLVIRKVLGEEGTKVILTILREGVDLPFDVEVTRARITIPTIESEMLENDIAYIRLFDFGQSAARDLREALRDLLDQNPKGLIFDLRGNGGGFLNVSVDVVSEFVDEGVVLYEQYGDGTRDEFFASGRGIALDIPMVVLVDAGSASASEIVAGAIQDYGRAPLVGVTTFGKGSVQDWIPLSGENGAVRVTIARWLTPNERQIHEVGLTPDYVIELTEEDLAADRDPQLEKAVELLLGE